MGGRLDPQATPGRCGQLDPVVVTDDELGVARLVWLNHGATSASAEWVKLEVAKLAHLEGMGRTAWTAGCAPARSG